MNKLTVSIFALLISLIVLCVSAFFTLRESLAHGTSGVARVLNFIPFLIPGVSNSDAQTRGSRAGVWGGITLVFVLASTCCFWWVVKEWSLRNKRRAT